MQDQNTEAMQAQISMLAAQVDKLTSLLTSGRASQFALTGGVVGPVSVQSAAALALNDDFNEGKYFVRVKPYNPALGHVRRRQYCNELGRAINGGTGQPGDIPEWIEVTRDQAMSLAQHRQRDDLHSPQVFDVVTEDEKNSIDSAESAMRAASLGLSGASPQQIMAMAARAGGQLNARLLSGQPGNAPRSKPSIAPGAESYHLMQSQGQLPSPAMTGRSAALAGIPATPVLQSVPAPQLATSLPALPMDAPDAELDLPPAPPPPAAASNRNVPEDLTNEAARGIGMEAALEAASKYAPGAARTGRRR